MISSREPIKAVPENAEIQNYQGSLTIFEVIESSHIDDENNFRKSSSKTSILD
jgi:hypothetical protein